MKNKVFQIPKFREYYLSEFELYDGECFITFNIVGIDEYRNIYHCFSQYGDKSLPLKNIYLQTIQLQFCMQMFADIQY